MKHRDFKLLLDAGVVTDVVATPNTQGKGWTLNVQSLVGSDLKDAAMSPDK